MAAIIVNLECITNMHVGNGDVNYNIIDNEVERDVVTGYPTINSSGVKGALREYFVKNKVEKADIDKIFGNENGGELKFLNADMVAIPVRASAGSEAFYYVSVEKALETQKNNCRFFLKVEEKFEEVKITENREAEGIPLSKAVSFMGKEINLLSDEEFRKISLPVLARNKLNDGKSVNLWYEEVVPHKSLFAFVVLAEDSAKETLDLFKKTIDGKIVQFGGNASIGYGLCKVSVKEG
ncbi:MAG: hypothetical protein IKW30_07020 [Lachnospiraceae bacterium]|nr:hypothetical protein [Lachnospiraceae bacterium]